MTTRSTAASYDSIPGFGALYDAMPAYDARGDVSFYVAEAMRHGAEVLELGCGTGRILLPMARAGARVVGIDGSEAMLERCRAKAADERPDVQARIDVRLGDTRDFNLGETFPLVIAPFRVMQHLATVPDQLRCLASVARHLAPGGRFIFDVFNPSFAMMVKDRTAEFEETSTIPLADGRTMRRTIKVGRVRWAEQVSETELIYYVAPSPGAGETRYVQAFDMRWYLRAELEHLLARAGLRIESVFGNFDRSAHGDASPEMIVTAVAA